MLKPFTPELQVKLVVKLQHKRSEYMDTHCELRIFGFCSEMVIIEKAELEAILYGGFVHSCTSMGQHSKLQARLET